MNLKSWMNDIITVQSMDGVDIYGQPTYGEQRTIKCRVEQKLQEVVSADGQTVLSNHEIAVLEEVKTNDRIWLPDTNIEDTTEARTAHNTHYAKGKNGCSKLWMVYM